MTAPTEAEFTRSCQALLPYRNTPIIWNAVIAAEAAWQAGQPAAAWAALAAAHGAAAALEARKVRPKSGGGR